MDAPDKPELRVTPAMEGGLADHVLELEELLEFCTKVRPLED
jgi:hypothetical protein